MTRYSIIQGVGSETETVGNLIHRFRAGQAAALTVIELLCSINYVFYSPLLHSGELSVDSSGADRRLL
jgi:hypothetical protein